MIYGFAIGTSLKSQLCYRNESVCKQFPRPNAEAGNETKWEPTFEKSRDSFEKQFSQLSSSNFLPSLHSSVFSFSDLAILRPPAGSSVLGHVIAASCSEESWCLGRWLVRCFGKCFKCHFVSSFYPRYAKSKDRTYVFAEILMGKSSRLLWNAMNVSKWLHGKKPPWAEKSNSGSFSAWIHSGKKLLRLFKN